jgi:hypothetical protein
VQLALYLLHRSKVLEKGTTLYSAVIMDSLLIEQRPTSKEVLQERLAALDKIEQLHLSQVQWSNCQSPEEYREMRRVGSNGFPKPHTDPNGKTIQILARDKYPIELRILTPKSPSKGVFIHFHAGAYLPQTKAV